MLFSIITCRAKYFPENPSLKYLYLFLVYTKRNKKSRKTCEETVIAKVGLEWAKSGPFPWKEK